MSIRTLSGDTRPLTDDLVNDLRSRLRGDVITPSDEGYDEARRIWNGMIDRRPALILQCAETDDVVHAVRFARDHGVPLSVRGGGHNIAGSAVQDDVVLVDLSGLRDVIVNPEMRTVTVSPGATLADVDGATQEHGWAVPTGINSTTGIAGLTLGGGFGWLSRSLGLSIDNLASVEIVTAEGERIICSEYDRADLFWAVRGGGGNFGIVTSFVFHLNPVGPQVACGPIAFPFAEAKVVLRRYRDLCASAPDALSVWSVLRAAPPLPFLDESVHGEKIVLILGLYNGSVEEGEAHIAQLRGLGECLGEDLGQHPYAAFQRIGDPLLAPGARNYWKSHNFRELEDGLLDAVIAHADALPSPQSEIFLAQVGGAANRVPSDATAYPHRDTRFVMNAHARWEKSAEDDACVDWSRSLHAATAPFATGGVYVNFISEGDGEVANAYGPNYERLLALKRLYDPENVFRFNQNIPPAGDA